MIRQGRRAATLANVFSPPLNIGRLVGGVSNASFFASFVSASFFSSSSSVSNASIDESSPSPPRRSSRSCSPSKSSFWIIGAFT